MRSIRAAIIAFGLVAIATTAGCSKKKAATTPTNTTGTEESAGSGSGSSEGSDMAPNPCGGDGASADPCGGGAADPCGGE